MTRRKLMTALMASPLAFLVPKAVADRQSVTVRTGNIPDDTVMVAGTILLSKQGFESEGFEPSLEARAESLKQLFKRVMREEVKKRGWRTGGS